ncbi:MAG: Maf family protein [Clostridia bacterium]|nr:Maf family protein [Clostridia bacterium]
MKYILASASPRRRELLHRILDSFDIQPAISPETYNDSLFPENVAVSLAESKCDEVYLRNPGSVVIACDTIVVLGKEILGKPADEQEASEMLHRLSGKTHQVITGVCVRSSIKRESAFESTEVRFNQLTEDFIKEYVSSGSPLDKAGAYGIQDKGVVKEYYGSYTNVVGLPVALVSRLIQECTTI